MRRLISFVALAAALGLLPTHVNAAQSTHGTIALTSGDDDPRITLRARPSKPQVGSKFRLRGRSQPIHRRQPIRIQLWNGARWRKVARTRTNKRGRFVARLQAPQRQSKTWYRAITTEPRIRSRTLKVRLRIPILSDPTGAAPSQTLPTTSPTTLAPATPVLPDESPAPIDPIRPRTLAGSDATNCGLDHAGTAWCWGKFRSAAQLAPAAVTFNQPFVSIATTSAAACGLTSLGTTYCWDAISGNTNLSQLPGSPRFRLVTGAAGARSGFCGLDETGSAWCWGDAPAAAQGEEEEPWREPRQVAPDLGPLRDIALSSNHICVIDAQQQAWCWGANQIGQLGSGLTDLGTSRPTPVPVAGGHSFSQITAAPRHSCALTDAGFAWCWGANDAGQLGNPATRDHGCWSESGEEVWFCSHTPLPISNEVVFRSIAPGFSHTCGTSSHPVDQLYCWGNDDSGQLGTGTNGRPIFSIMAVSASPPGSHVVSGAQHSCILATDASIWCWGTGEFGQLGIDAVIGEPALPQPVVGTTSYLVVSAN